MESVASIGSVILGFFEVQVGLKAGIVYTYLEPRGNEKDIWKHLPTTLQARAGDLAVMWSTRKQSTVIGRADVLTGSTHTGMASI